MGEPPMPGNGRVQVAYLHAHRVSHSWHESMMRLIGYDAANHGRIVETAGPFMISSDASGIADARNAGCQRFLDETDHDWLFFIDTDMGFLPDTIDRLVDAADPHERPVVGGLCFALREVCYDGYGGRRVMPVPTLYQPARTPDGVVGFTTRWEYPPDTVLQVAGTGAACLLIHRQALEKMRAEGGDSWFDRVRYEDGKLISEDLSFCARLMAQGIRLFVHTGVKTTHHKQFWVAAEDYVRPQIQPADPAAPEASG
jgi:GT2 family glycosyltransferase